MKFLNISIILCILLSFTFSSDYFLTKYGSIDIVGRFLIFESKDFKNDEEMHFKIRARRTDFAYGSVNYKYIQNKDQNFPTATTKEHQISFKSSTSDIEKFYDPNYDGYYDGYNYDYGYYYIEMDTKYFSIKKQSSEFDGTNGEYMAFQFPIPYVAWATVTNTKGDEAKTVLIVVIVVVIVVVLAIIITIIVCCIKRAKRNKILAESQAAVYTPQQGQQNIQAQAYPAQPYQAQPYPQSYPVPIAQNNAGYSSAGSFIPS